MLTQNVADPVSAEAVNWPRASTFTVATANTPVPFAPGMLTIPGSARAARATISGTGPDEADSRRVLTPEITEAPPLLAQLKFRATSVGGNGAVGVNEITKV